jgi:hypothetical protein
VRVLVRTSADPAAAITAMDAILAGLVAMLQAPPQPTPRNGQ